MSCPILDGGLPACGSWGHRRLCRDFRGPAGPAAVAPQSIPRATAHADLSILCFSVAIAAVTELIFGLAAALRAWSTKIHSDKRFWRVEY
jgi:hypothetical protein